MSHLSKIFEEAPIKVQNRNGFDLSHVHAGTSKTGQLVPVLTKVLVPNTTISLGVNAEVNLPPLVSPFYGKVDFAIEGFVVPLSILYGGWKQFISNQEITQFPINQSGLTQDYSQNTRVDGGRGNGAYGILSVSQKKGYALPYFDFKDVASNNLAGYKVLSNTNDNIYNYMGNSILSAYNISSASTSDIRISLLPALAYHKICDTFYRNTKLTRTWFAVNPDLEVSSASAQTGFVYSVGKNVSLAWHSFYTDGVYDTTGNSLRTGAALFNTTSSLTFPDGVSIFSTRQRTYMRDYFTSAVPSPQQGGAAVLQFNVDSDGDGQFTINALRMANSLQKWLETANLSGAYDDINRNRWGIRPIDADFDEPHYLGRVVVPVYNHSIYQSVGSEGAGSSKNPYVESGILGSRGGVAESRAEGSICDNFNVSCWSYLMVLASLVPHANYNYGLNRELTMTKVGDFPAPELQGVGMEEIKNYEIGFNSTGQSVSVDTLNGTFGYTGRYSRLKYMDDRVSGELMPGRTLEYFQLQRSFSSLPELGTEFVTIPQNALDGVLATTTAINKMTCWWEIFFNFKVVMPLADYCIPTLGELQDTHTIKTTVGGSRL